MRIAHISLRSVSPYSQSKHHGEARRERETGDDHEKRTWRERLHTNADGYVVIPPMAFKNCLSEAAKFLGMQIPGKGKSTYTKHFEAGLLITEGITLDVRKEDVQGEWFFVPADGRRGSGKRVSKCFPVIPEWSGDLVVYVLDDAITEPVLKYHCEQGGKFIGIGRFRPRNNGFYGRFEVTSLTME